MNSSNKELDRIYNAFSKAFINRYNEMIIYPRENTYFLLDNVNNELELECKVLEYCSRQASKGMSKASRKYHFEGICDFFNKVFSQEEMDLIYIKLGNGINRKLCIKYIESGFDLEVLKNALIVAGCVLVVGLFIWLFDFFAQVIITGLIGLFH